MARFFNGNWDPYRMLFKLQDEINKAFNVADSSLPFLAERGTSFPRVNVWTGSEESVLNAEVPGVAMDSMEVTVEGDTLTLKGERKPQGTVAPERYYRCERGHGSSAGRCACRIASTPERSRRLSATASSRSGSPRRPRRNPTRSWSRTDRSRMRGLFKRETRRYP